MDYWREPLSNQPYFPESADELDRLVSKTNKQKVINQAVWAGLKPGMKILDVGCGPGITTQCLAEVVGPTGHAVGIDRSPDRLNYAREHCHADNTSFVQRNFFDNLDDLGSFDFIWARFVIEYFLNESFELVEHITNSLKPGGICCLADLDHNCLNHFGASERLNNVIQKIGEAQMCNNNFDPYVGRKLFTCLHDLGFTDFNVDVQAHHIVFGDLSLFDRHNWWYKIEVAGRRSGLVFDEFYEDGFAGFEKEFKEYLADPRRFIYTPLIIVRGVKPQAD